MKFNKTPLGLIFEIHRSSVNPYNFPKKKFFHHSIPAFDTSGGPEVQYGQDIQSNKNLIDIPCILVSKLNPRKNRVSLARPLEDDFSHCASTEFIAYSARSNNSILSFYKWYFQCDCFRTNMDKVATGTTNSHVRVTPSETLSWLIPTLDVPEQHAIAAILDTIDETIRRTEVLIAKLRQIKAGMLHDLLTCGLDDNGELRDPVRYPEQFKDSPLGRIPKEWKINSLGSLILELEAGVSVNAWNRPASVGELGVLKTSCVFGGVFSSEENKTVLLRDKSRLSCPVRANSIIISRMNTPLLVGESGYVETDHSSLYLPDRLWQTVMRKEKECSVKWLSSVLNWEPVRKLIRDIATGTSGSMKNISKGIFLSINIRTPLPYEQEAIASRIGAFDKTQIKESKKLTKLYQLKQGLMQDLLTGRIRVPESVLKKYQTEAATA